jgi:hypothetical protein
MKLLITLFCLVLVSTGFAQQTPTKKIVDPPGNLDNMPVLKDTGHAREMPTRKGQGITIDMPVYLGPVTSGEIIATFLRNFDVAKSVRGFQTDSTDRSIPDDNKRQRSGKKQ